MYASYAVNGVSDGTFTQDPRVYRPEQRQSMPPLEVHQLLCDEMTRRTEIACDALTDFQRIVSMCVAERHGQWTYTLASAPALATAKPRCGWSCPRCGHTQQDVEEAAAMATRGTAVSRQRGLFAQNDCRTPLCTSEELRKGSNRCQYAADASDCLERQYAFEQEFGGLLQRIKAASRGIQDSVTR